MSNLDQELDQCLQNLPNRYATKQAIKKLFEREIGEAEIQGRINGLSAAWGFTTMFEGQELKDLINKDMQKAKAESDRLNQLKDKGYNLTKGGV